jgi:hypothetical protein
MNTGRASQKVFDRVVRRKLVIDKGRAIVESHVGKIIRSMRPAATTDRGCRRRERRHQRPLEISARLPRFQQERDPSMLDPGVRRIDSPTFGECSRLRNGSNASGYPG